MSSQVQPINVYPSPNTIQPQQQQQHSSSHSNGSFGPVFIVLAVIVVLTIIATILGRICSRRRHGHGSSKAEHGGGGGGKKKAAKSAARQPSQHDHNIKFQAGQEGDIEFGFHDKNMRIPTSKVADNGHGHGHGDFTRGPNIKTSSHNGEHKGHVRFADDHIEFRAGPN